MRYEELVGEVESQLALLVAAVGAGTPTASVPTCGDWTVADLVHHVGGFCGFWSHVLCEGTGRARTPFPAEPGSGSAAPAVSGPELAAWLGGLGGNLVAELVATPATTGTWTWFADDRSAAFVARRCAHELAVHRYDAEVATGGGSPMGADLAADGIDELFFTLASARRPSGRACGQTLHVHGTDPGTAAEWLVTLTPAGVEATRTHAKGDLALRGACGDLELLLYRRPPLGPVERLGDASVLDRWYDEFVF